LKVDDCVVAISEAQSRAQDAGDAVAFARTGNSATGAEELEIIFKTGRRAGAIFAVSVPDNCDSMWTDAPRAAKPATKSRDIAPGNPVRLLIIPPQSADPKAGRLTGLLRSPDCNRMSHRRVLR
jgi:hypothetical protein